MEPKYLWRLLVRVAFSILSAGVFYFAWMGVFLFATKLGVSIIRPILWLLGPVITATGFAAGIAIFERLTGTSKTRFLQVFIWPLIGCVIGAGVVYPFGPMLIVFGMFTAGIVSVVLRELLWFSGSKRG